MDRRLRRVGRAIVPGRARHELRLAATKWRLVETYGGIRRKPAASIRYLVLGREIDNFTYRIANIGELARFLGDSLGADPTIVQGYIDELASDVALRSSLRARLRERPDRESSMPFGRRLGWYAVARIRRPKLIVETGVHDGLGSTALLRALQRNDAEGHPGRLISFDVRRSVGWLIPDDLRQNHRLVVGDAIAGIASAAAEYPIDIFIHDSDHRYDHETAEFETAIRGAGPGSVLISDNAHASTAFSDFCARRGLRYRFWHEEPRGHFYPGAGIGIAIAIAGDDGG